MNKEEIKEIVSADEKFYSAFYDQCDSEETYYNLKFNIPKIEGFTAHYPSTARVAIDDAAAQIDPTTVRITVPPRTNKPRSKESATKLEKFYHGCWDGIQRNDGTLFYRTLKGMYMHGVGFWKTLYDADALMDAPQESSFESNEEYKEALEEWRKGYSNKFPFMVLLKHPKSIMVDPSYFSTGNYTYVIEKYKRKAGYVKSLYPSWNIPMGKKSTDDVEWVEAWTTKGYAKFCEWESVLEDENGTIVDWKEHDYGFIPYDIIDGGLGYSDYDGTPESRWRGLLNGVHFDLELEARIIYQIEAILRLQAFSPQDFQIVDENVDRAEIEAWMKVYSSHPGSHNVIPFGVQHAAPPALNIPAVVFNVLGVTEGKIETATVSKAARGQRAEGVASGYMAAILAGMARIKFGPALESLQRAIENVDQHFAQFIENLLPEGITVWGKIDTASFDVTVDKEDIKGYYVNDVKLTSIAPEEESRKLHDGIALRGFVSDEYIKKKYLGIEDTITDLTQQITENALKSPEVQQILSAAILQSSDLKELLKELMPEAPPPLPESGTPVGANPMGNAGNPPAPMQSGPRPTEPVRPVMPGSPQEGDLVARQIQMGGGSGNRLNPLRSNG